MNLLKKSGLMTIMGLLAFSVFASDVAKADTNPFASQDVVSFAADNTSEGKGKCGEGKCGESKAKGKGKCGEGKCGEGKGKKCGG
jgi:uncharacterized low-complexity protein